ncbi:MAG TPA: glycosyltransferase [Rariglobus sp.]|jgi:glycosyltransferase involved in cell wall biosynthesis|nr:glycosyltransferase [Rariglobus sp.]
MKWLIVEDALRDNHGHWIEYISTFKKGLLDAGDSVEILCDEKAEPWVIERFAAQAVLPESIWHRIGDGAGKLTRLFRIPIHAVKTWLTMRKWLTAHPAPDIIFVPTVLVHHLLGWYLLTTGPLRKCPTRILLFFPNTPVNLVKGTRRGMFSDDPTARLFKWLIRRLAPAVQEGKVILGVETIAMRNVLMDLTAAPFTYLPHPVPVFANIDLAPRVLTFAAYGPGRHEKGSDLLQQAISLHLEANPKSPVRFKIQWLTDFVGADGSMISKLKTLLDAPQVEFITHYFQPGEYARRLAETDVLVLPYRIESYGLRVSRVVIEAMVHGIPIIATAGTTLTEQAEMYGACVECSDGSIDSLLSAIQQVEENYAALRAKAGKQATLAIDHFSVKNFRKLLMNRLKNKMAHEL